MDRREQDVERERRRRSTRCSFCGKRQDQVRKLVAGPGVYICDRCIGLCQEVLDEDSSSGPSEPRHTQPPRRRESLALRLRARLGQLLHSSVHRTA